MKFLFLFLTFPLLAWDHFDQIQLYHHHSDFQTQWAFEIIGTHTIQPTDHILDYGCGDGKLTSLLSYRVPRGSITGIDISPTMLDFASHLYPTIAFHSIDWTPPQSYDLITSFCVMHLVTNPLQVLRWMHTHLKATGMLILTMPYGGNYSFWQAVMTEMEKQELTFPAIAPHSFRRAPLEEIRETFSEAEFKISKFSVVPTHNIYATRDDFAAWCEGSLGGHNHWKLSRKEQHQFFINVVNRFIELDPSVIDKDGFLHFKMQRIDIIATP